MVGAKYSFFEAVDPLGNMLSHARFLALTVQVQETT